MRIRSFAKINLGLEILGERPDGYHEIRTLYQAVDLCDELEFEDSADDGIVLEGDDASIPWDASNLVHKAASALREAAGVRRGARIKVYKRIPAGRGLGGGSSNAAVSILALDRLWGLGLGAAALRSIAGGLGSDVAYFLHGGLCLGEGRGEVLTELADGPSAACVIGWPDFGVSTPAAYRAFPPSLTSTHKASKINRFLEDGEFRSLENDLESVVVAEHPEIARLKGFFQEKGAALALMSGSGSAVFGLFPERETARIISENPSRSWKLFSSRMLARKEYWNAIGVGASPSW